jgi:hypothetical protein
LLRYSGRAETRKRIQSRTRSNPGAERESLTWPRSAHSFSRG